MVSFVNESFKPKTKVKLAAKRLVSRVLRILFKCRNGVNKVCLRDPTQLVPAANPDRTSDPRSEMKGHFLSPLEPRQGADLFSFHFKGLSTPWKAQVNRAC